MPTSLNQGKARGFDVPPTFLSQPQPLPQPQGNPDNLYLHQSKYATAVLVPTMADQKPESIYDALRRWRKQLFWPALWVLTIFMICKGVLFRHPSSTYLPTESQHNITENKKYYSTPGDHLGISNPAALDPNIFLNVSKSTKVAVIVETRSSGYIVPLILHFHAVLGHAWPLIIYSEAENFGSFSTSAAFVRLQKSGRITVRPLADGVYFPNWGSVSGFLTDPWLWNDLAPAEHILIFQADSILCSNSVRSVDDFLQYDMIGAPINPRYGHGYNGGLSLRKRSTIMRVLKEFEHTPKSKPHAEDQWYYAR